MTYYGYKPWGWLTRRSPSDFLALILVACVLGFFYRDFLTGRTYVRDDNLTEFYPGVNYFAKSIHEGRFPLWFSGVRNGLPFYSDPQMAVFYPPQWLLVPFVENGRLPFLIYQRYIILHYLLGGLFMYAFLKEIKLRPIAALGGALVFCLSGFASTRISCFVIIQVYVWLPLQLLFVHRYTSDRSRWAWLGLVWAILMSLLAGHQQTAVYCWYVVIAYWLHRRYYARQKDSPGWRTTMQRMAKIDVPKLVGTFVLVFGLGGVLVVPGAENWWRTGRPRQSFEQLADSSLPYPQLLTLLVPNFFGETRDIAPPVPFWGYDPHSPSVATTPVFNATPGFWQYSQFAAYAGQVFWLALLLILFNWRSIEDKLNVSFFLATWVVAIWFMLGRYGGFFQVLYYLLPGVSLFRIPACMSCIATFAAATLSAYLVDLLIQRAQVLRYWPAVLPSAGCVCLYVVLTVYGGNLADGLRNPDRLNWARRETYFALLVGGICALAFVTAVRARKQAVQTGCICALLAISVADFHHAYGDFHRGHVSPDEYFPETNPLLTLLRDYHERLGPFRFGQIIDGRVSEEALVLGF